MAGSCSLGFGYYLQSLHVEFFGFLSSESSSTNLLGGLESSLSTNNIDPSFFSLGLGFHEFFSGLVVIVSSSLDSGVPGFDDGCLNSSALSYI